MKCRDFKFAQTDELKELMKKHAPEKGYIFVEKDISEFLKDNKKQAK